MTTWSTAVLLVFGVAIGPYGLDLLSPALLLLVDPGVAMALAMLGVFVGVSVEPPITLRSMLRGSGVRTLTVMALVGAAVAAIDAFWLTPGAPRWLLALSAGVCAAASHVSIKSMEMENIFMIVAGAAIVAAILRGTAAMPLLLFIALAGIAITVAFAGWLLVGQTSSEAEQHVFVVGSLLLLGGAATYLSLSAVFAGLMAGLTWNAAGHVAHTRIVRDLNYLQHPFVVLALVVAAAAFRPSIEVLALAAVFVVVRPIARRAGAALAGSFAHAPYRRESSRSMFASAGLVGVALALDVYRADGAPAWATTLIGATVLSTIVAAAVAVAVPPKAVAP